MKNIIKCVNIAILQYALYKIGIFSRIFCVRACVRTFAQKYIRYGRY